LVGYPDRGDAVGGCTAGQPSETGWRWLVIRNSPIYFTLICVTIP